MSKREESFLIEDIVIAIESIIEYTKAFTYTDYLEDQKQGMLWKGTLK